MSHKGNCYDNIEIDNFISNTIDKLSR